MNFNSSNPLNDELIFNRVIENAKNELHEPPAVIYIQGLNNCTVNVSSENGDLCVDVNGDVTTHSAEKYRHIEFSNLENCSVKINCKLIRIFFRECKHLNVNVNASSIGPVELFRCKNLKLYIVDHIPVLTIEHCDSIVVHQEPEELVYVVKLSVCVAGMIDSSKYQFGKLIWGYDERKHISLSRKNGVKNIPTFYKLQEIKPHLMHGFSNSV